MNILLIEWGAYTENDFCNVAQAMGISVKKMRYHFIDKNNDEEFETILGKQIRQEAFEAVFTVNYFPVVAKVCKNNQIKYLSWSYDAPLNVINIEETLGYETNYAFMFDRLQYQEYKDKGFDSVYYLPLAVNTKRYDGISVSTKEITKFGEDITFVGNLYSDILRDYMAPMNDYQKGMIQGICAAQKQLYGAYIIDEVLTEDFINSINKQYKMLRPDTEVEMTKPALSFAMASQITRDERLTILGLLSKHQKLGYYSREKNTILSDAKYMGTCDYYLEMPMVFKLSKINLNITLRILKSGIPLRALDIMGCGGFLLSNYQPELAEYFEDGKDLVMYGSIEEAFEKTNYYLGHESEREKIAASGYEKVKRDFTYEKRIETMFRIAGIIQ